MDAIHVCGVFAMDIIESDTVVEPLLFLIREMAEAIPWRHVRNN